MSKKCNSSSNTTSKSNSKIAVVSLTISKLAQAANVNIETIRYYQRIGLLNEPAKPVQGYRKYSTDIVEQLIFIKRAQQLGFSLKEISELLSIGDGHCSDVRQRAEIKRDKITTQINDLLALRTTLDTLINSCHKGKDNLTCPIITSLLASSSN